MTQKDKPKRTTARQYLLRFHDAGDWSLIWQERGREKPVVEHVVLAQAIEALRLSANRPQGTTVETEQMVWRGCDVPITVSSDCWVHIETVRQRLEELG